MDSISIIGLVAAAFTTVAFVPQVIKAHNTKHTKDLSLFMFVVFSIGLMLWIVYGIMTNVLPIILANAVTLLLSLYMVLLKIKYG